MTIAVSQICRHPIKSHGHETIPEVVPAAGETLPFDFLWAVALDHWGHSDFSVRAEVVRSGRLRLGDEVTAL